jgi:hypothetical protein
MGRGGAHRGGGNNGATAWRRRGDGSLVGRRGHEAEEREEGVTDLLERALTSGDEIGKKGGHGGNGAPFIGDVAGGVGDGPQAVRHGGGAV